MATEATMVVRKKSKADPKPQGEPIRKVIASFRGTEEFAGWLERLGKHVRLPVSTLLEDAAIELAKARGFDEQPPER